MQNHAGVVVKFGVPLGVQLANSCPRTMFQQVLTFFSSGTACGGFLCGVDRGVIDADTSDMRREIGLFCVDAELPLLAAEEDSGGLGGAGGKCGSSDGNPSFFAGFSCSVRSWDKLGRFAGGASKSKEFVRGRFSPSCPPPMSVVEANGRLPDVAPRGGLKIELVSCGKV